MLSSVTMALAILTVTADGAGQPSAFRLSEYVRKTEARSAVASKKQVRAPVRLAQAPSIVSPSMGSAPAMAPVTSMGSMDYGTPSYGSASVGDTVFEGHIEGSMMGEPCMDCGPCSSCGPYHHCGHHRFGAGVLHGLPSPWHSRGDLPQHMPYLAMPKTYYYFRPYQWFHIPVQQAEVTSYGGDPRHPYANREFQEIYHEMKELEVAPHLPIEDAK